MTRSDQLVIGNCTFCGGVVRIPLQIDGETEVRCPHCSQTSGLDEMLKRAIPELEIVSREPVDSDVDEVPENDTLEPESADQSTGPFQVSPVLSKGAERRRRSRRSSASREASNDAQPPEAGQSRSSRHSERPSGTSRRQKAEESRRRKQIQRSKNGEFELFKIAAGAMLALPVAQIVIWWLVQVDPLNLGPGVSRMLPAIVPVEFRAPVEPKPGANTEPPVLRTPPLLDAPAEPDSLDGSDGSGE